jgi:hypothetical protein
MNTNIHNQTIIVKSKLGMVAHSTIPALGSVRRKTADSPKTKQTRQTNKNIRALEQPEYTYYILVLF